MTYHKKLQELEEEFAKILMVFLQHNKEAQVEDGFLSKNYLKAYSKAYFKMIKIMDKKQKFLAMMHLNKIKLDDKFPID